MTPQPPTRSRLPRLILLAISLLAIAIAIFSQQAFNLKFLRPESLTETFGLAALSILMSLALLALIFVLGRNLLKLYFEYQAGVAGSRFRSKLVLGALVLSFGPVIAMFLFSYGLMNRSIDKWFSQPIEQVQGRSKAVTELLTRYAGANALAQARSIAATPEAQRAYHTGKFAPLVVEFREHELALQGGFALAFYQGQIEAAYGAPAPWSVLRTEIPALGALQQRPLYFTFNKRTYVLGTAPVEELGHVAIALPLPERYGEALASLDESQRHYDDLRRNNKLIRQTYMQALLLITVLVLFSASWSALALSKLVTRPVAALAAGTQAISSGDLAYRVDVLAGDELGQLVDSFNSMTAELEHNRRQLQEVNSRLDERRLHMETILESIPSGVVSLDAAGQVTRVNAALIRMLQPHGVVQPGAQAGIRLADLFPAECAAEVAEDLRRMTRKAARLGLTSGQLEITSGGAVREVGVTVASMMGAQKRILGYVIVLEDMSELLRAQKQAAWREVAQRVAHEIKNPLTPIALSSERIRRHAVRAGRGDAASLSIIDACAATIGAAVETVRRLVDEFALLARFPQSQPQPADLNAIVQRALTLFDGRLAGVDVQLCLSPELPAVLADPEAIKRVVANLVENAAESMGNSALREIRISTSLPETRDAVELEIADSGEGVSVETKEKLFLPYFSTKARGTGLGLSIVARILEEHGGTIRVEANQPVGTRFTVELPLANGDESAKHTAEAMKEKA